MNPMSKLDSVLYSTNKSSSCNALNLDLFIFKVYSRFLLASTIDELRTSRIESDCETGMPVYKVINYEILLHSLLGILFCFIPGL